MKNNYFPIIGYIHICQKGEWKKIFKILIDKIKESKLYENSLVIRLGIVNDDGIIIEDEILNDPKFNIIYIGKSNEYERPTLLDMREKAETDDNNTNYYYLHTKGIQHFGKENEPFIYDWINLMLYWNIEKWELAIEKLKIYDIYGCNEIHDHYSGNFWWTKKEHIIQLPKFIEDYYTAPEHWIQKKNDNKFCIYRSGYEGMGHYYNLFPREKYVIDNN